MEFLHGTLIKKQKIIVIKYVQIFRFQALGYLKSSNQIFRRFFVKPPFDIKNLCSKSGHTTTILREVTAETLLVNAALQTVCTAKIKPTNQLIYTTARVVVDMVGYRMNSHKEQDPPWRRRLEAKSKTAWGEVSQQSEMQKGVMNGCPINPLSFLPFSVRTVSFLCLCAISLRSLAHVFTPTATLWLR